MNEIEEFDKLLSEHPIIESYFETINRSEFLPKLKELDISNELFVELVYIGENASYEYNPLIWMINNYPDAIKNFKSNLDFFDAIGYKFRLIELYYGIIEHFSESDEYIVSYISNLVENFDKNVNEMILNPQKKKDEFSKLLKSFNNLYKLSNYAENQSGAVAFVAGKVYSVYLMRMFLKISETNEDTFNIYKYIELNRLSQDYYEKNKNDNTLILEEDFVIQSAFDKLIELINEDYEENEFEIMMAIEDISEHQSLFIDEYDEDINYDYDDAKEIKLGHKSTSKSSIKGNDFYKNLESFLKTKLISQGTQIDEVVNRLKLGDFNLNNSQRPKAVILLAGPTGVGKTELVKLINEYYSTGNEMIRLDMSEYKEEHEVSKIYGAPPGYVGFDSNNSKTIFDRVIASPNAFILLDELEKAHPKVLDTFLHVFDEGVATTNKGAKVDFSNTIIFMTSNIGAAEAKKNAIGFSKPETQKTSLYKESIEKVLKPEFINRIDLISVFNTLQKTDIEHLIDNYLALITEAFKSHKDIEIELELDSLAKEALINSMNFEKYGARDVKKAVDKIVITKIIEYTMTTQNSNFRALINYDNAFNFEFIPVKVLEK